MIFGDFEANVKGSLHKWERFVWYRIICMTIIKLRALIA